MGWSHTQVWQIKIGRDISATEDLPEEGGIPAQHQTPQPRVPVPGREVPISSGCKKPAGIEAERDRGLLESQAFPLKEPTH